MPKWYFGLLLFGLLQQVHAQQTGGISVQNMQLRKCPNSQTMMPPYMCCPGEAAQTLPIAETKLGSQCSSRNMTMRLPSPINYCLQSAVKWFVEEGSSRTEWRYFKASLVQAGTQQRCQPDAQGHFGNMCLMEHYACLQLESPKVIQALEVLKTQYESKRNSSTVSTQIKIKPLPSVLQKASQ